MDSPLISAITPCYNQGDYIEEAIQSIPFKKVNYGIEHIIINDGSTDTATLQKFVELEAKGVKIVHQENKGLAATRNKGISLAKGKYIITLDADNKLTGIYFTKAVEILECKNDVDIVYGNFTAFGNENRMHKPGDFDINKMIEWNKIDACAIFRKSIFEKSGGYDVNMVYAGCEDWDLWLNLHFKGATFYYIDENAFYYRVTAQSMLKNITEKNKDKIISYVNKKYSHEIIQVFLKKMKDSETMEKELAMYKKAEKQTIKTALKLLLKRRIL